jgi:hypothetical protein
LIEKDNILRLRKDTFGVVLQIKGLPHTEKEKYHHLILVEGDPLHPSSYTQSRLYVEPMTPCASPRYKVRFETFSLVVSEGIKDINKGSHSSGTKYMTTQIHLGTPSKNIVQYTMTGVDSTLRMFVFHGARTKDLEQHLFICEVIWTVKKV